jgi:hypothetical protein
MKLNVLERLLLLQILPAEGDFVTLKIIKGLKESVALSEGDFKEFDIKQESEQVLWNQKGNEERAINIGEKATDVIVEALKKLDNEKKLLETHVSLYEKFIN